MTKEQKKAIGRLHGLLVTDFNYSGHTESGAYWQHSISFRKDHKYYADAIETVLSMLEEKDKEIETLTRQRDYYKARYNELSKIVDSMAKHIYILGDYACLYEECDDNMDRECEDCIKEYFYKKVKETKDNGSTRNV